jgi:hypothetical protein
MPLLGAKKREEGTPGLHDLHLLLAAGATQQDLEELRVQRTG